MEQRVRDALKQLRVCKYVDKPDIILIDRLTIHVQHLQQAAVKARREAMDRMALRPTIIGLINYDQNIAS